MKRILCILVICSLLLSVITSASAMDILNTYAENDVMQIDELGITLSSDAEDDTDTGEKTNVKPWCVILYYFCYNVWKEWDDFDLYFYVYEGVDDIIDDVMEVMKNNNGYDLYYKADKFYNMSDEEAYVIMQKFIYDIEHAEIKAEYFNRLYEACYDETNDNGYYSKENWDKFTKALKTAKEIYERELDGKYSEDDMKRQVENCYINNAYFDLRDALKNLCLTNTTPMDLDRDGDITLKDVVKLQRYIAKLEDLNISEKVVVSKSYYGDINLTAVTDMQKYIAKLKKIYTGSPMYDIRIRDEVENALFYNPSQYIKRITWTNHLKIILEDTFIGYENYDLPSY